MVEPIRPEDIIDYKINLIPDYVIEVVNELLIKNWSYSSAVIKQNEVVEAIMVKNNSVKRGDIFTNKWLDFEPIFEKAGWKVVYDKPGWNEDYEANWRFSRRPARME